MKVNTIEQFKVMEYIKKHFEIESIKIEAINRTILRVTDNKGQRMDFYYENNDVKFIEPSSTTIEELQTHIERLEKLENPSEIDKAIYEVIVQELKENHKLEYVGNNIYAEMD